MDNLGNKKIMAKNIQYYMDLYGKSRSDMCDALGVKYTTFTDRERATLLQVAETDPRFNIFTGQRFGRLTAIEEDSQRQHSSVKWICRCDCGRTVSVSGQSLRNGATRSCGCLRSEERKEEVIDLTGKRFGNLVVIGQDSERDRFNRIKWICKCDCGNVISIIGQSLRTGNTKSCGCKRNEDLTGQRFGRLTVIEKDSERDKEGHAKWLCRCDCGNVVSVTKGSLKFGHTRSCGCLRRDVLKKRF